MKDGCCKVASAHINQVRKIIFRGISVYSKVAVRPQHCGRCGVIQQLLTAYIEECLHQHISTHNVATLAKVLPWFDGRTMRSIATGRQEPRSTSTCPPLPSTKYWRGRRNSTRQSAPNWILWSRGRNNTSRQSATTWFKWQRSNTNPYSASSIYQWGSPYSYSSKGTTSWGQEARRQAAWNSIEETHGAIRVGEVQHNHPSGWTSGPYSRLGTSWRQHKAVFTIWGRMSSRRMFLNARLHCLDRSSTTEKPSGGGENGDNSKHLFSQVP